MRTGSESFFSLWRPRRRMRRRMRIMGRARAREGLQQGLRLVGFGEHGVAAGRGV